MMGLDYLFTFLMIGIQSEDEKEMCARTVYCTNIDKKVSIKYTVYSLPD